MSEGTDHDIYAGGGTDHDESGFAGQEALTPAFSGTTGGYFRIWIVNVVLTIITLGFFTPWAKVRTRRYFYINTRLGEDPFDYLADPKRLLYGYLILVGFLICYNFLPTINPVLSIPVLVVGIVGFPWVIYKSRRFFCRNSAYRNVRYRFTGTLGEAYSAYVGIPILAVFTLGLAQPYAFFRQKEYFFKNVSYGGRNTEFSGKAGYFFKIYYLAGLVLIGLFTVYMAALLSALDTTSKGSPADMAMVFPILLLYLGLFFGGFILNALVTNYCWNNTEFPGCARFICSIQPLRYAWIEISNAILSVISLGLLIPWAKVRMYRYRMSRLQVELYPALDDLVADQADRDDGAFGDMAADEFDFEIGL